MWFFRDYLGHQDRHVVQFLIKTFQLYLFGVKCKYWNMGKTCRVKKCTLHYKKRRGFCRKKLEDVVNTWNEGDVVNSSVNIESPLVNNIVNNIVNIDVSNPTNASLELDSSTVSSRKVQPIVVSSSSSSCESISGYRIIDLEILSNVFTTFLCPSCEKQKMKLSENGSKKKGLVSLL